MRKSRTAVVSLLLLTAMTLTACGGNNNAGSNTANDGAANDTGTSTNSSPAKDSGPIENITVAYPMINSAQKDTQLVEDAINKITEVKIQTHVKLNPIGAGEWAQQLNLMFTSNAAMDLIPVFGTAYSGMVAKSQLVPLNELLDQHGSGIREALGEDYLGATKIKGESYAVPTIRDLAVSYGFSMVKSLADKYNIDANAIKTLDDFEEVLTTVKNGEKTFAPLVPASAGNSYLDTYVFFDRLGDSIGVLPNYDNDLKVVNLYESQDYKDFLTKVRKWYQDGLAMKDAATNKTSTFELVKSGKAFGTLSSLKPGFAAQEKQATGIDYVVSESIPPVATTSSVTGVMWGIPINSKQHEKAMQFLNLMYTDKDIVNLFDWGIEGKHYVKGQDNVIKYPEGADIATLGYSNPLGYLFGNQFLSYVMDGNDPEIWSKMQVYNESAKHSKALGFVFDSTPIKTEYAAVSNVVTQYKLPLETGSVDPDKILPEFISKLKSAGIDKIIAEKQKQLDEWAKSAAQ
ncbi:ABC transporter substrate-binding protein [Paenibacillus sp. BC26]|uniref:ABC transporter substrate-binding protein n=1 Tax=Paenibacillus sp. BC26 TaxID=1881032 RepID=UPI0008E4A557|nr:ABC transporter substrate-binding protein [Paenibacillus sp. BC26]SFS54385.1 putative aldouronate transport system substrate-binding protein [Paenibacillus sp. BC26]